MTLLVGRAPGRDDDGVLDYGAVLARSTGRDLVVAAVVPAPWPTPLAEGTDRDFRAWAEQHGGRAVEEATRELEERCPDVSARAVWVSGRSVPGGLLDAAREHQAEMVIVGPGRAGSYGQVHLSSTADRLLHSAPLPVAVATRGYEAPPEGRVGRVTCAFRGDEASRRTLRRAAEVCARIGASVRLVTFAVRGRDMYPPEVGLRVEDDVLAAWVERSEKALAAVVTELGGEGLLAADTETAVSVGRSWRSAIDRAGWERDDVLAIGSSAEGAMSRLFLGSNATKIVRSAPVPVIVVP